MIFETRTFWGAVLAAGLCASGAAAQTVAMATDQQGTTFNTVGSGIATVASENSELNVIVRPYSGPAAWAPIVNTGEVAFGVMSANSGYRAYSGDNEADEAYTDLRLIRAGGASLQLGFAVREDSDIESFEDLEGKRISSDFGGHLSIANSLAASLRIGGLDWDDVTPVPVTGANDGLDALVADRLDATWASAGQPRAREADTQVGIRYLSVPDTEEAEQIYQEMVFPGARLDVAPAGSVPGIDQDTLLLSYDSYLVASVHTPDEQATAMLEALWSAEDQLAKIHPSMRGFTQENAVTDAPVMPYHPAATEFYKAHDMWSEEDQQRQDKLTAQAEG